MINAYTGICRYLMFLLVNELPFSTPVSMYYWIFVKISDIRTNDGEAKFAVSPLLLCICVILQRTGLDNKLPSPFKPLKGRNVYLVARVNYLDSRLAYQISLFERW